MTQITTMPAQDAVLSTVASTTKAKPASQKAKSKPLWGAVQGSVELPTEVLTEAKALAAICYAEAEEEEFSGDAVQTMTFPTWLDNRKQWIPLDALKALGFEPNPAKEEMFMSTPGVDAHSDDISGPSLIVVLFNDGLKFKQGKNSHVTTVGQWYVFDDRLPHEVRDSPKSTVYLAWSVPLRRAD